MVVRQEFYKVGGFMLFENQAILFNEEQYVENSMKINTI